MDRFRWDERRAVEPNCRSAPSRVEVPLNWRMPHEKSPFKSGAARAGDPDAGRDPCGAAGHRRVGGAQVRKDAETFGVRIGEMGLKDVILPGEMRDILNQVVTAEKQSQANLIRRREETAATRSLLNTVKLMEDNPLMVRLKELETPIGRGVPPPRLLPTAFPKTVGSHPLGGERRDPGPT